MLLRWRALLLLGSLLTTCSSLLAKNCKLAKFSEKLSMSTVQVEVTSDFACPWCYVGKARLNAAVKAFEGPSNPDDTAGGAPKVHFSFRPYMIDMGTEPLGEDYLAYNKRRWGGDGWTASMKRSALKDGCDFAKWVTWPNSLLAHRLQMFAEKAGKGNQVNSLVFQTIYERGGNASDLETLVSLAEEAGLPPADARAYLRSREGEEDVLTVDRRAKTELDVRGVPYFVVRAAGPGTGEAESAGASSAAAGVAGGGTGRPAEVVLKGAVSTDELIRAFATVSRGA
eukprot:g5944.t1